MTVVSHLRYLSMIILIVILIIIIYSLVHNRHMAMVLCSAVLPKARSLDQVLSQLNPAHTVKPCLF